MQRIFSKMVIYVEVRSGLEKVPHALRQTRPGDGVGGTGGWGSQIVFTYLRNGVRLRDSITNVLLQSQSLCALLLYVHDKQLRSCRDGQLTTLFLGRLRPPKGLTSTQCPYRR